jgi:type II secretory pathway pseudopilin PulG
MSRHRVREDDGFSIVETVIAAGILITMLASLAQLIGWSLHRADDVGARLRALVAAQDKIEQLRAAALTMDLNGTPVTDAALTASPTGSLDRDIGGFADALDASNQVVTGKGAVVLRRWSVIPLDTGTVTTFAITVCAFRAPAIAVDRRGADACISTARVRQP